jgi:tRNA(adenine34) deaminase
MLPRQRGLKSMEVIVPLVSEDLSMMRRCIDLSKSIAKHGEFPFSAVIYKGEKVIAEAGNHVFRDRDTSRHAELLAVSRAQATESAEAPLPCRLLREAASTLLRKPLSGCTICSNVEPCAMCSFAIREAGINRVIYSIKSPLMGGSSRWNILGDQRISEALPEYFVEPLEVNGGVLAEEAEEVWRDAHPIMWEDH